MKTILFVDDDAAVLSATQRKLRSFKDWHLIFANGGLEAIQCLNSNHVDAVVTDVYMPGMSGLDLLRHVVDGLYGFIPVVVITGMMDKDAKRQALEIGAQDLLSKPVDMEDLVARLRSVLALKSYHDETFRPQRRVGRSCCGADQGVGFVPAGTRCPTVQGCGIEGSRNRKPRSAGGRVHPVPGRNHGFEHPSV